MKKVSISLDPVDISYPSTPKAMHNGDHVEDGKVDVFGNGCAAPLDEVLEDEELEKGECHMNGNGKNGGEESLSREQLESAAENWRRLMQRQRVRLCPSAACALPICIGACVCVQSEAMCLAGILFMRACICVRPEAMCLAGVVCFALPIVCQVCKSVQVCTLTSVHIHIIDIHACVRSQECGSLPMSSGLLCVKVGVSKHVGICARHISMTSVYFIPTHTSSAGSH
jgi:hypothetical protein